MPNNSNRFTVFDAMENRGAFSSNPANSHSRDKEGRMLYKGPLQYPRLMYHPKGREEIVVPGTAEMTPYGPVMRGEQRQIISKVIETEEEYKDAVALGWHDHPAKAIAEGNKTALPEAVRPVPAISSAQTISDLEKRLKETQEALALAQSNIVHGAKPEPGETGTEPDIGEALKAKVRAKGLV